jgi:EAL domain-containing protein (putative c-di-GMP-specific phosphodiesterase class I)
MHHVLDETGADPRCLCIEITESVLMDDVESAIATLRALRALGIRLWVDDFGTGYSSLAYLRRLPLDGLKIDQSFVAGLGREAEDTAIAAGIVSLAHTLGLVALAEGVETQEQLELLRELGCDFAQGYYWSRPRPLPDLAAAWPR